MDKPVRIESEGNFIEFDNENNVHIGLSREKMLDIAIGIWAEYKALESKQEYNKWLSEEMKKAVEARLKKELKNEKNES